MPACSECNAGTKTADAVASIIARWDYFEAPNTDHDKLLRGLKVHRPDIIEEWRVLRHRDRRQAIKHLRTFGVSVPHDAGLARIGPITVQLLNLFAHKATLGLYFEHFRTELPPQGRLCAFWRTKEDFWEKGVPSGLLEMMQRYGTLEQGRWNTKEIFEYRYEINPTLGLFACLTRLRGGLFVTGLAVRDVETLDDPELINSDADWIAPPQLLDILSDERFKRRR